MVCFRCFWVALSWSIAFLSHISASLHPPHTAPPTTGASTLKGGDKGAPPVLDAVLVSKDFGLTLVAPHELPT